MEKQENEKPVCRQRILGHLTDWSLDSYTSLFFRRHRRCWTCFEWPDCILYVIHFYLCVVRVSSSFRSFDVSMVLESCDDTEERRQNNETNRTEPNRKNDNSNTSQETCIQQQDWASNNKIEGQHAYTQRCLWYFVVTVVVVVLSREHHIILWWTLLPLVCSWPKEGCISCRRQSMKRSLLLTKQVFSIILVIFENCLSRVHNISFSCHSWGCLVLFLHLHSSCSSCSFSSFCSSTQYFSAQTAFFIVLTYLRVIFFPFCFLACVLLLRVSLLHLNNFEEYSPSCCCHTFFLVIQRRSMHVTFECM